MNNDADLLEQFVGSFSKLNEMYETVNAYPMVAEFAVGESDEFGFVQWQPIKIQSDRRIISELYAKLPSRLPPLFETLLLSYRWAEVDLQLYTLLANPPGQGLSRFFHEISKDPGLWESLIPAGYIQFAKGPDIDYDPVCFDIKSRTKYGDCRIVKIDHEEILCNNRIKIVAELAPGFHELVEFTIQKVRS